METSDGQIDKYDFWQTTYMQEIYETSNLNIEMKRDGLKILIKYLILL